MLRNLNQSFSGRRVFGTWRAGTLAAQVASETAGGDSGSGLMYAAAIDSANAGKYLHLRVTSWPAAGNLFVNENGAFSFTGAPDGTYTVGFDIEADNVAYASDTATLTIGSVGQLLSPASDVATGGWSPSTGATLYGCVDEATADDADYITAVVASTCEVKFGAAATPSVSTGHVLRYRLLAGTGNITVALKCGTTTIATFGPHALTGSAQDFAQTLTSGQAASITDYTDLRVTFTSS